SVCGESERIDSPAALRLTGGYTDVAKAVLAAFDTAVKGRPFRLEAETEVPMRAGLAGSTAMLVAILGAVLRWLEVPLNRWEIAEAARKIEYEGMAVTCGFQDQYMAVFGGINCMDFGGKDPKSETADPLFAMVE